MKHHLKTFTSTYLDSQKSKINTKRSVSLMYIAIAEMILYMLFVFRRMVYQLELILNNISFVNNSSDGILKWKARVKCISV